MLFFVTKWVFINTFFNFNKFIVVSPFLNFAYMIKISSAFFMVLRWCAITSVGSTTPLQKDTYVVTSFGLIIQKS